MLGRTLVQEKSDTTQLVMATHSSDVIRGLLDAEEASVTIVRLTRAGDVNPAAVLDAGKVRMLWQDPLPRYSNILDGLFHEGISRANTFTACPDRHRHQTSSTSSGDNTDLATTHHPIHLDGSRSVALTN